MNPTQIKNQVERIKMMDHNQLTEFATSVYSAVGMSSEMFSAFKDAIAARHKALSNSFNFEVEPSELREGELL